MAKDDIIFTEDDSHMDKKYESMDIPDSHKYDEEIDRMLAQFDEENRRAEVNKKYK